MPKETFETAFDNYATNYGILTALGQGRRAPIVMPPNGHYRKVERFYIEADTTWSAQNTNYATFLLKDSSGNTIASVANGPATGGLDIDTVGTAVDTTMVAAYQNIDCRTTAGKLYVVASDTGGGVVYTGLRFAVVAEGLRG